MIAILSLLQFFFDPRRAHLFGPARGGSIYPRRQIHPA